MNRFFCAILILVGSPLTAAQSNEVVIRLKQTIALPGVEGRLDHLAFDPARERIFLCALGNNSVEVLDLKKGERVHSIPGLGAPQGIACVPFGVFVANDKGGICSFYDATSFRQISNIDLQDDADNVRHDQAHKRIYVGFGSGGIAILNSEDGKQIGAIKLSAHPEAFELEKNGSRIFVNVPDSRCVEVIDRAKGQIVARWKTDLAFGNFPMALDEEDHRLFIGCRLPSKLVVLNTDSGEVVMKVDISSDSDEIFYDRKRHRIYTICGVGKIDVIQQTDANTYKPLTKIDTAKGARTGLFVSEEDKLFVAVPHNGSQRAEVRVYQIE